MIEKTTGTADLKVAQTVSGSGTDVTAVLITDPVTLSAASNATVTGNVTAEVAGNIANVTDITAAFSGTITDTLANLADSGSITTNFDRARGDDTDVKVVVRDGTGTLSAADLAAITAKTSGTVTLQNAQTVSGTGDEVTAALITNPLTLSAASNGNSLAT